MDAVFKVTAQQLTQGFAGGSDLGVKTRGRSSSEGWVGNRGKGAPPESTGPGYTNLASSNGFAVEADDWLQSSTTHSETFSGRLDVFGRDWCLGSVAARGIDRY